MKNVFVLCLTLLLALSLCACGKSEKATAVEDQITALGEITLQSETAITNAEKAWQALTEEDKKQVENYDVLTAARSAYKKLILEEAADKINQEILKIGEMKSGRPDAVKAVKKLYESAAPEVQALVKHKDLIDTYLNKMDELKAEDATNLIADIGKVTFESKDSIVAAKKAYYALPNNLKEKVDNAEILQQASDSFIALSKSTADEILSHMHCLNNEYFPEELPWADETSISATERCFFTAYLVSQNNGIKAHILANYTGEHWVFFNQIMITTDENQYTLAVNPFNVKRDDSRESIWERLDIAAGDSDLDMLRDVISSEKTVVTFKGYEYEADYIISESDREGISNALKVYDCMDASYEINHPGA